MGSNPIIAPDSEMLWNAAIVWRILRRYEYTGALVMGRRKKIDVNTTSVRTLPEDKWIIAENAHAAIVTRDEYYQAQKEIRALTKQASEKTYIGGLTKECVDAFVSMVYLYDDQTMKIEFNCEDVIRRALEKYGT